MPIQDLEISSQLTQKNLADGDCRGHMMDYFQLTDAGIRRKYKELQKAKDDYDFMRASSYAIDEDFPLDKEAKEALLDKQRKAKKDLLDKQMSNIDRIRGELIEGFNGRFVEFQNSQKQLYTMCLISTTGFSPNSCNFRAYRRGAYDQVMALGYISEKARDELSLAYALKYLSEHSSQYFVSLSYAMGNSKAFEIHPFFFDKNARYVGALLLGVIYVQSNRSSVVHKRNFDILQFAEEVN